ncbi:UDP-N-acetylglucosamine 2-epimerase (non-hydrolyzing) [Acinetobacter towneri]|uniref:non-hydrolyzing UDP-N-acetylglucosamine 2-epimerase n=1 Tax=Acinetobacter towneri TaxID=202956 RepID=UPI001CE1BC2E|nr:UDP-N-acetylglucosamine 2-epimerase (non-hydrolyzing) [Acinetobacter towneri]MCA4778590.1 UDP-N-acetylglucosamine 2-epimerase (non-hydrolyzing) [Acinetobacter towneri]MCA4783918.1 UDP-N-acetylglucosamine 2-epimerase (non-hydrolyzing) [Acinetobacter towneri]MCA4786420.1 UDP-N-acetylglucosamine 2-epimerase (non-hydrolyzing) [Acinetobacter towneri]MCA4795194.1 UDP-N-acetylglucosamine 2-epimerase (non-hydrolyzing) [Acinetobacter towneri]MCA4800089.1 UDP-N-acetylglucosamine 2-epimerase (non-hydr
MRKINVLVAFGTRPEAIKMAPVVKALQADASFDSKVLVTAQHREMLDQVLAVFDIKPDFDLDIMKPNQTLTQISSNILGRMDDVFNEFRPDIVLVHGDTLTAFVVAQAAFYNQIDIGHVEAGLRTNNLKSPWPEEGNRQLISRIANLHFAPTEISRKSLIDEGLKSENIYITGNTVIDALLSVAERKDLPLPKLSDELSLQLDSREKLVLITGHRRENFGDGFKNICLALKQLAKDNPKVKFIYPVHLNPNVKNVVNSYLSDVSNIILIPPQSYLEFVNLMKHSHIILTDSGGIQEEAPSLGIPVLVMRETTERPEAISARTVKLVGTNQDSIISNVQAILDDKSLYRVMSEASNPYGDGYSAQKIVTILKNNYS